MEKMGEEENIIKTQLGVFIKNIGISIISSQNF